MSFLIRALRSRYTLSTRSFSSSTKADELENAFKDANAATFLAAASSIASIPNLSGLPEVIVAGRANVGKSTLLNAVVGRTNLVHTSKKAGRTRALNFFRVGREPGSLVLVDAPGYGMRGRAEWGTLWDHYVDNRKELRQICILINTPHGLTDFDRAMLEDLNTRLASRSTSPSLVPSSSSSSSIAPHIPIIQPILTKLDALEGSPDERSKSLRKISKEIRKLAPGAAAPVLTAMSPTLSIGVEAMRRSIAEACAI